MSKSKTLRVENQADINGWETWRSKYGTDYRIHSKYPQTAGVTINFWINVERLDLIEELCDLIGTSFKGFVEEAIYEKMDREVREPNLERFKRQVHQRFLTKWDTTIQNRPSLQDYLAP